MSKGKIVIDKEACKGCEICIDNCKFGLIKKSEEFNLKGYHFIYFDDPENKCNSCCLCAISCPDIAIEVYKED